MPYLCPRCGQANRTNARFCIHCGQGLKFSASAAPNQPNISTGVTCPVCGTVNQRQANYCYRCGRRILQEGTHPPTPTGDLGPQTRLQGGRYVIERLLGKGGMGAVYQALDTRLPGKRWAIKEMSTSGLATTEELRKAVAAFQREAQLLARLNHPNLPKVIDHFEEGGRQYLVMELIEGQTLADMLDKRRKPFPVAQVIEWGEQLCDVLGYLHSQKPPIIFRDLKPANIMVEKEGTIKLIDFGIARHFKPGKTSDTQALGTGGYAPPEQYGKGQTDARSDIYALAATLHQLLTLRDPSQDLFNFPPARQLNRRVPEGLSQALAKALARDPADRWNSTSELRQALRSPAAAPSPAQTSVAPPARPSAPPVRRRRAGIRSYLLLVAGLTGSLVLLNQDVTQAILRSVMVDPTIAAILYLALSWLPPVLSYLLTRCPLAAFLVCALGMWASRGALTVDLNDPSLQAILIRAGAIEAVFLLSGYRRQGTLLGVIAAVAGADASLALRVVRFGYQPSATELALILIAALLGGLLAGLLATLLRRG